MKITAIHDNDGRILAAVVNDGKYDGPKPVPDKNTLAGTFEVPATESKLSLQEICKSLWVDVKAKRLVRR